MKIDIFEILAVFCLVFVLFAFAAISMNKIDNDFDRYCKDKKFLKDNPELCIKDAK